jgi:hypothetical protein
MSDENKGYRYENRYLTKDERYDIDYEFRRMLSGYQLYLRMPRKFSIFENIVLTITDIGVLTLFVNENNKKLGTRFDYNFIK